MGKTTTAYGLHFWHRLPQEKSIEEMMIYTPTQNDAYQSTLTKGLVGLQAIQKFPDAKWFAIMGDDVFVDGPNLASALSAFNPNEEWCLAQCNFDKDAEALTRGTSWRIFGGAPIITSQSLTKRLARFLLRYHELVQNGEPGCRQPMTYISQTLCGFAAEEHIASRTWMEYTR